MIMEWFRNRRLRPLINEGLEQEVYSPDVWSLEMKTHVHFFEFGPPSPVLAENSVTLGTVFTVSDKYALWQDSVDKQAIALPIKSPKQLWAATGQRPGRIKGTLYLTTPEVVFQLDRQRFNGLRFLRDRVSVDMPHHKKLKVTDQQTGLYTIKTTGQLHQHYEALTYIGISEYWSSRLDGGYSFPKAKFIEPEKSKPFYEFQDR